MGAKLLVDTSVKVFNPFGAFALCNAGMIPAVLGTMFVFFCLEFTIVSNIPLLSEQAPGQRGKALALGTAGAMIGRTLGSFTGPWAYTRYGVWVLGPVSACVAAIALVVIWRLVREAET